MTEQLEGQMNLFDQDISFGRMFPEACQVQASETEKITEVRTSKPSSRKSSKPSNQTLPMFLCLRTESGQNKDACMEWERTESPFPSLTNCMMHSGTVYRNEGKEFAYWLTSMDTVQPEYCLSLNLSEHPREENPSHLSEILEDEVDPRYSLSPKACLGILKRASRRGKALPDVLKEAGYCVCNRWRS